MKKNRSLSKNNKKGKNMNTTSKVISNIVQRNLEPQISIVDRKSNKHFGILLTTQQSIEEFQTKSGMNKAFTSEYQFHYWALVARIKLEDEVLDIAMPTVLFNYNQKVAGASVDFHLKDVEDASNANLELANACASVLIESDFGKYLLSVFPNIEWINVPMNTCHVHPGSLSTFSGTDYSKTINDPGIVFPLAQPLNQPSFSSIICHDIANNHVAKMVRTEYRNANKVGNEIIYEHGTCLAYIRDNRSIEYPPIQSLFTLKQSSVIPSYINKDGVVVLDSNEILNSIIKEFDKMIDWSPYTLDILENRIQKRVYTNTTHFGYGQKQYGNSHISKHRTFEDYWGQEDDDENYMTLTDYRNALVKFKVPYKEVYALNMQEASKMYEAFTKVNQQLKTTYTDLVKGMNYKEVRSELLDSGFTEIELLGMQFTQMKAKLIEILIEDDIESTNPETIDIVNVELQSDEPNNEKLTPNEVVKYLLANGVSANDIKGKSIAELEFLFEEIFESIQEEIENEATGYYVELIDPRAHEFIN